MSAVTGHSYAERRVKTAALLLTAALVLLAIWGGLRWWLMGAPEAVKPAASALTVSGLSVFAAGGNDGAESVGTSMVSSPLFWPGRQAYVSPDGAPEIAEPVNNGSSSAIDKTRLLGVYSAGSNRGVILEHQGQKLRLKMDEAVDGWTLAMLSADGAIFESGRESRTLRIEHALPEVTKKAIPVDRRRGDSGSRPKEEQLKSNQEGQ